MFVVAACVLVLACEASRPAAPDPPTVITPSTPGRFFLRGRIADMNTAMPMAGVLVTILDGPDASRETTTAADGTFGFADVTFGGLNVRARAAGYDSVFEEVRLTGDTFLDLRMRPAHQSLAGVWNGELRRTVSPAVAIEALRMTHVGPVIAGGPRGSPVAVLFSGTLEDPSAIEGATQVSGTLTVRLYLSGRNPMTCDGTGAFRGTIDWSRLVIPDTRITYSCGGEDTVSLTLTRQQ
jgi:hypothetical protein